MTRKADPRTARLPASPGTLPTFTPVPRKGKRHDGWTEERQRGFIEALADTGSVHAACKAVDMSQRGAYYLRRQPGAESFREAWEAALQHGVQRIEDAAMDRALNGVEVPVYSYGKLVGSRTVYNDRLLMFILRNRAPERFAEGKAKGLNAVGKMEMERLKKQWRKEWEREREEEQKRANSYEAEDEALASIDAKLDRMRRRVLDRQTAEWRSLTPETRSAYRQYIKLRARDLGCEPAIDEWAISEEEIAELEAREREVEVEDDGVWEEPMALPPPDWGAREEVAEDAESEADAGPRVRTLKDDGWG